MGDGDGRMDGLYGAQQIRWMRAGDTEGVQKEGKEGPTRALAGSLSVSLASRWGRVGCLSCSGGGLCERRGAVVGEMGVVRREWW